MTGPGALTGASRRNDDSRVRQVLVELDMRDADLLPLGAGLASEAWRIGRVPPWFALRIAHGIADADSTYEMEHALMSRLADAGAWVPRPIRGSWQSQRWAGPPFSLTTGLEGAPLAVADHRRAAPVLAAFLRRLHAQHIAGFGPLRVEDGELRGRRPSMAEGLLAWAGRALWPVSDVLAAHPALGDRDVLRARLDLHAPTIRGALDRGPGVPLHSDLHEENILDSSGELGIIDFGEAFIGPVAWEFAALAYFLGWSMADATLAAYAGGGAEQERLGTDANAIGLCFGVHRWAQDRRRGVDQDLYNEAFVLRTLTRM